MVFFHACMCFKIFEQFVKTRIKEEYKERKSKLLLAKEEFKKLLEESKVSPRYGKRHTLVVLGGQKCVIIAELTSLHLIFQRHWNIYCKDLLTTEHLGSWYFSVWQTLWFAGGIPHSLCTSAVDFKRSVAPNCNQWSSCLCLLSGMVIEVSRAAPDLQHGAQTPVLMPD